MKERIEQVFLIVVASVSIVISIADLFGFFDFFPNLPINIPSISLLLLGIIIGYLVYERRTHLSQLSAELIQLKSALKETEANFSGSNAFINAFQYGDSFSEIMLIYRLRGHGILKTENTLHINEDMVLNIWRDCMARSSKWEAFTYTYQDYCWDIGWGEAISDGIQLERIKSGGVIRRVFIIDDETEFIKIFPIMMTQKKIDIDVRWILAYELEKKALVASAIEALGTKDISTIDGTWILRIFLDQDRMYTHAEVTKNQELVDKAKFVFREAFQMAKEINVSDDLPTLINTNFRSPPIGSE